MRFFPWQASRTVGFVLGWRKPGGQEFDYCHKTESGFADIYALFCGHGSFDLPAYGCLSIAR